MSGFVSFANILEEKIEKKIRQEWGDFPSENTKSQQSLHEKEFDTSPANLSFLLGQVHVFKAPPKSTYKSSAAKIQTKKQDAPLVKPAAPERKKHVLSPEQQVALLFFQNLGLDLDDSFALKELKTAFRKAAHKLHPDLNKSATASAEFINLKKYYAQLIKVIS